MPGSPVAIAIAVEAQSDRSPSRVASRSSSLAIPFHIGRHCEEDVFQRRVAAAFRSRC